MQTQNLHIFERDGVDGNFIMETGFRGKPFTIRTTVDADNLGDAAALYVSYTALINGIPVAITWHDIDTSVTNVFYQVLDVRPVPDGIRWLGNSIGGLNGGGAICECDWDLLPVVIPS